MRDQSRDLSHAKQTSYHLYYISILSKYNFFLEYSLSSPLSLTSWADRAWELELNEPEPSPSSRALHDTLETSLHNRIRVIFSLSSVVHVFNLMCLPPLRRSVFMNLLLLIEPGLTGIGPSANLGMFWAAPGCSGMVTIIGHDSRSIHHLQLSI